MLKKIKALLLFIPNWFLLGSPLKTDEEVIFFPTAAYQSIQGQWIIPIHAWVFEPENGALLQRAGKNIIGEILELADVSEEQTHSVVFEQRIKWFLVDNERNKRIVIKAGDNPISSPRSKPNGHAKFTVKLNSKASQGSWITLPVVTPKGDNRTFNAEAQLIPAKGVSVISDIDDTIKVSEVLNKKALIQHIFFKDYQSTPGMPEFYAKLKKQGAYFHYLSASPWQLYPSLQPFIEQHYPKGSLSLRYFRATDTSFIKFFMSSMDYKINTINEIIERYPQHQFILIGDSGEKDPEVYATIYAKHSENIKQILIRNVPGSDLSDTRKTRVFKDIPAHLWEFFDIPKG